MPYPTGPTDPNVVQIIRTLRKKSNANDAPIWKAVSKRLLKSRRSRPAVNLSRISRYADKDDVVVVPGKVLSSGELKHPVTIAALAFSERAIEKITAAKGKAITLLEAAEAHPNGTGLKVIV